MQHLEVNWCTNTKEQECIPPVGCVPSSAVAVFPGGGVYSRGVSASGGWYPSMHWGRHPPPHVDRQTPVKTYDNLRNFVADGKNRKDRIHPTLSIDRKWFQRIMQGTKWWKGPKSNFMLIVVHWWWEARMNLYVENDLLLTSIINFLLDNLL